ncbi:MULTISPECIES: D-2-hydroxyacid dehydrogenase [Haloarcula]|uniref:D-2-hydroxyacid dehydrogenase n=1 Tax=Haloarcula TaxID=2237 RepID=UPI0023ECFE28|nr:D-2-hydroxyacid dehydrogenase [Halomicroarcula sp. XH51]
MALERLGIHPTVSTVFPPAVLRDELADSPIETVVLEDTPDSITGCDAIVTFAHREAFFDVDWVHSIQAGVDRFPEDRFDAAGVVLTNSTGIHGDAIGETVASYVLAFARRLHEHVAHQQAREWSQPDWDDGWTVAGERACVVGLGGLGRGIVDRLTGLDLDVTGVRRTPTPEPGVDRTYTPSDLETAVADARFVVLAVPLTDETEQLVDGAILDAMAEDAYLINVARGGVIDQDALRDALDAGSIAGAALDVFETEPLPESSPLWAIDEVIVSPHCGAFTRDYGRHVAAIVRESVRRFRDGRSPVNRVV